MNEDNDIYQQEIVEEDDDMMPDGWAEGDDFFEPDSWSGATESESASEETAEENEETSPDETESEEAPATEPTDEAAPADSGATEPLPATEPEQTTPSTKRRVKYQFDHQDVEEDIDDADLPELLQKARSVDRYKQRLDNAQMFQDRLTQTARAMKYDTAEAFLDAILENAKSSEMDNLRGQGVPQEIAEDYISRKYAGTAAPPQYQQQPVQPQQAQPTGGRDYASEARELLNVHPELVGKSLPNEVYAAAARPGVSLLQAYTDYEKGVAQAEAAKTRQEAEKLRKENRILKNNADSADRAPVSGVSRGGRASDKAKEADPFLAGFDSDDW